MLQGAQTGDSSDFLGNPARGFDDIHGTRHDRASGHPVVLRGFWILGESEASFGFDHPQTHRPVRSNPRKNDPYRLILLILRKRIEKEVNRQGSSGFVARREFQNSPCQAQVPIWRNHIDMVALDACSVLHLSYRHWTYP